MYAYFILSYFLNHEETSHLSLNLYSFSYYTSMYTVRWYRFNHFGRNIVLLCKIHERDKVSAMKQVVLKLMNIRYFFI